MKNIKISVSVLLLLAFTGCMNKNHEIRQGPWLGLITIDSTDTAMVLPFNMELCPG